MNLDVWNVPDNNAIMWSVRNEKDEVIIFVSNRETGFRHFD